MHLVRNHAAEFGVRGVDPDRLSFDLPATVARKDQIIQGIIDLQERKTEIEAQIAKFKAVEK